MYLNTPCQAAQNTPQFFVILFGSSLTFFTMTNTWFSLKTYHDKITALKHKSTAHRLSELKQALEQQKHGGHSHKGLCQQITTGTFVHSTFKATCTKLWQTMLMTTGSDPSSGHRKDVSNWEEPLWALRKIIFSSRLDFPANQLNCHTARQMNQISGFKP